MKILYSAYSCEPNKGSESGVGWNWALEIARLGHELWVLTRANNQPTIEEYLNVKPVPNIHFLYYDLPGWIKPCKKLPGGLYLFYLLWQWGACRMARRMHKKINFELLHHITFGSVRLPTFIGCLGVPLILGPIGGGERAPLNLRFGYGIRGWISDTVRDISNYLIRWDPLMHITFSAASWIYVKTPESEAVIPRRYQHKIRYNLRIAVDQNVPVPPKTLNGSGQHPFKLIFAGRLLFWKGMHLGLRAFARLLEKWPNSQLTIVGSGPDKKRLHSLAEHLKVNDRINWISQLSQKQLFEVYGNHDVLFFPSLHDSGGLVVVEAMSKGLPAVVLDLGGPGVVVNETCGFKVNTAGLSQQRVVQKLADRLGQLAGDPDLYFKMSKGAIERTKFYSWPNQVDLMYKDFPVQDKFNSVPAGKFDGG